MFFTRKGDVTVCALFDEIEKQGRAEGEEKKAKEAAKKLYQRGNSPADIADIVGYAVEVVEKWLGLVTV